MKLRIIIIPAVAICCLPFVSGQSTMDRVLRLVEANSATLKALQQQTEARKVENRTGIYPANPEAEFGYLWGNSASTGNRTDFSITQSFDFPTAYAHRSAIAAGRNRIAGYEYELRRRELLFRAAATCAGLVYCNALKAELDKRLQHAQRIASAYRERVAQGDMDILERNKAQLNLLNARKAAEANDIERTALLAGLQQLNGGEPVAFGDTVYPACTLPADFEQWFAQVQQRNPAMQIAAAEVEVSRQQEKLNRAMSLPKISAGYASEAILGTLLQGVTVGVSIPLRENKNTVRQAKMQTAAWQSMEADIRAQFHSSLKMQHARAQSLQALAADYRKAVQAAGIAGLLKKALDLGQLSLTGYIAELSVCYDATDNVLRAERDAWLAILELRQWEE